MDFLLFFAALCVVFAGIGLTIIWGRVYRQDTGELIGYLTEPEGPFPGGITY
jgi:hypothetical protein